jgi:hypothetical protein
MFAMSAQRRHRPPPSRKYQSFADGCAQMAVARQQRGDWVESSLSRHVAIGFGPIAFDCRRAAPGLSCAILHDA